MIRLFEILLRTEAHLGGRSVAHAHTDTDTVHNQRRRAGLPHQRNRRRRDRLKLLLCLLLRRLHGSSLADPWLRGGMPRVQYHFEVRDMYHPARK
jgi:hypothetical protein